MSAKTYRGLSIIGIFVEDTVHSHCLDNVEEQPTSPARSHDHVKTRAKNTLSVRTPRYSFLDATNCIFAAR